MKILSVGNFTNGWDGSICDEEHIAAALESLGHTVTRWQREQGLPPLTNGPLEAGQSAYDFMLVAQWDGYDTEGLRKARDYYNTKLVYWAFDYQAGGQEWHEKLIAASDLYLSKRIEDSKYPNWRWLSQDFAPPFLDKYNNFDYEIDGHRKPIEQDIDVLFTGSYLPWAIERIETLRAIDQKFNLVIHSVNGDYWKAEGFKNVEGPIMDDGLPALYSRAKINISIDHTLEAGYWSDRNAQIMACGGFVLFRYVPLSEATFRDNISYFYDTEDCLRQIEFYLNSSARHTFAENGYRYAQENLMVDDRVRDLITIVRSVL